MPAMLHRVGDDAERWQADKQRRLARKTQDTEYVRSILPNALLTPKEAARACTTTVRALTSIELEGRFPRRVMVTKQKYGYRQSEVNAWLDGAWVPKPSDP